MTETVTPPATVFAVINPTLKKLSLHKAASCKNRVYLSGTVGTSQDFGTNGRPAYLLQFFSHLLAVTTSA